MDTKNDLDMLRSNLREVGVEISNVHCLYELANADDKEPLRKALPVLLELLPLLGTSRLKQEVVRTLAAKGGHRKAAFEPLILEYKKLAEDIEKETRFADLLGWEIANTFADIADESCFEELTNLLRDQRLGRTREMLCYAVARPKRCREEAIEVLLEVLPDDDVTAHAIDALSKLKAVETEDAIRPFLNSPRKLVRRQATKALKKFSKLRPQDGSIKDRQPVGKGVTGRYQPPGGKLHEISANFDIDELSALLSGIAALLETGFGDEEISSMTDWSALAESGDEEECAFDVVFQGSRTTLQVKLYLSDESAVDVCFMSQVALIEKIHELMDAGL